MKLDLDAPEEADALVQALELGVPDLIPMQSVYFDTPDLRLARHGYSLRIRQERDSLVQTLKAGGTAHAGLFARQEWERPMRSRTPELDADSPAVEVLGLHAAELGPRIEVTVTRSVWLVETAGATVELVLDRGAVTAGDASEPICEVELEIKRGDVRDLFALARRIGRLTPVRIGVLSKAARGERLLKPPAQADKQRPVPLVPEMAAGDAFRAVAHACIRQYRLNEARLLSADNAEALHQARVALRRLRTAFVAFRPIVNGKRAKELQADLRWLTGQLGQARNIDVLIHRMGEHAAPEQLKAARGPAYAVARRAITSDLARERMIDLAEWLSVGRWTQRARGQKLREEPVRDYAARAIGRLHDRLMTEADAIAGPDDEARHEARKTAKKLRYTAEFFALLFDKGKARKARIRYLAALEELQDHLGALNDLTIMPETLASIGLDPEQAEQALGDGGGRDASIGRAADAMRLVAEAKRFWE